MPPGRLVAQRWAGFDVLVLLNDSFFMPLLFLLSGLLVWGGPARKGAWFYLRGRLLRLGLPFAAAALTVVPLAYYPSFLQAGGSTDFVACWTATVTTGSWPSGPPWFAAVLLLFDAAAALAFVLSGQPTPASPVVQHRGLGEQQVAARRRWTLRGLPGQPAEHGVRTALCVRCAVRLLEPTFRRTR